MTRNSPKICIVTTALPGAYETFIRAHIRKLPNVVAVICGYPFPEFLHERGVDVYSGTSVRQSALRAVFRRSMGLESACADHAYRRLLAKCGAEVVLAEFGTAAVRVANACKSRGIPLVAHFHGADCYKKSVLEQVAHHYPQMFETAKALVVVSRDMESRLQELGADPSKICYVPYGVDFAALPERMHSQRQPKFVAIGRFVEKKAPYLTLLAFANVLSQYPETKLVFVGGGPLMESCVGLARGLSITESVNFVGEQPHAATLSLLSGACGFLQHSVTAIDGDSEGTPNAVLEASALGIPVIATRHAGIKDAILDGGSGYLVEEFNVDQMSQAMLRILNEPKRAEEMGQKGREFMLENFSQERQIADLAELLTKAITHSNTVDGLRK